MTFYCRCAGTRLRYFSISTTLGTGIIICDREKVSMLCSRSIQCSKPSQSESVTVTHADQCVFITIQFSSRLESKHWWMDQWMPFVPSRLPCWIYSQSPVKGSWRFFINTQTVLLLSRANCVVLLTTTKNPFLRLTPWLFPQQQQQRRRIPFEIRFEPAPAYIINITGDFVGVCQYIIAESRREKISKEQRWCLKTTGRDCTSHCRSTSFWLRRVPFGRTTVSKGWRRMGRTTI